MDEKGTKGLNGHCKQLYCKKIRAFVRLMHRDVTPHTGLETTKKEDIDFNGAHTENGIIESTYAVCA